MPAQRRTPCNWLILATSLTDWVAGQQRHICGAALSGGHASVCASAMGPPDELSRAGRLTSILLIVAQQVWELLVPRIVQDHVLVDVNEDNPSVPVFELV